MALSQARRFDRLSPLLLVAALAAGCLRNHYDDDVEAPVWTVNPIVGPDGTKAWAIVTCIESKANCFSAASQTCRHGYDVADTTDHTTTSTRSHASGAGFGNSYGNSTNTFAVSHGSSHSTEHFKQEILVHCRDAPGAPAASASVVITYGAPPPGATSTPAAAAPSTGATIDADPPFDANDAKAQLVAVAAGLQSCKKGIEVGTGRAVVTFAPTGLVQTVVVTGDGFDGTPIGACINGRFRGAHVQPFSGSAISVSKSFTIN